MKRLGFLSASLALPLRAKRSNRQRFAEVATPLHFSQWQNPAQIELQNTPLFTGARGACYS
jgi:hypothetical protein